MKKRTKIALLVAAGLFTVGLVLSFIAWSGVGFHFSELSTADEDSYVTQEEAFAAADYSKIDLRIDVDDVQVRRSQDDDIHLTYTDRPNLVYALRDEGGTLVLEQQGKSMFFGWFSFDLGLGRETDCILFLPESYDGDLLIENDVGDVDLSMVSLTGALDMDIGTGSIEGQNVSAKSITAVCDVGDITAKGFDAAQYLFLDFGTGSIYLGESSAKELTCQSDVGGMTLMEVAAGTASLSTGTGDIQFPSLTVDQLTTETDVGDVSGFIDGAQSEYTIFTKTDVGSSNLDGQKGSTDKELDLTAGVGSIDVKFLR